MAFLASKLPHLDARGLALVSRAAKKTRRVLHPGAIAGIILGAVILVAAVVCVVFMYLGKKRRERENADEQKRDLEHAGAVSLADINKASEPTRPTSTADRSFRAGQVNKARETRALGSAWASAWG